MKQMNKPINSLREDSKNNSNNFIAWVFFISVWFFNVFDLITEGWFYSSVSGIIFSNFLGVISFIYILINIKGVEEE